MTNTFKEVSDDRGQADKFLGDICKSLDNHKAEDVVVIDLKGKSDIADYMVIASGQSNRQVATMADRLMEVAKKYGVKGITPEGRAKADWVLFDAGDIVIHLFRPEVRQFYNLEKMWNAELPNTSEPTTF